MAEMIDVVDLVRQYCPEAEIMTPDDTTLVYMAVDFELCRHIGMAHHPARGWWVTCTGLDCSFKCPNRAEAEKLAKTLTTQVMISKGSRMEELEGIQARSIDRLGERLKEDRDGKK